MHKQRTRNDHKPGRHVTLQMVADRVGLTKGTCSAVLNDSAASRSIPQQTRERILVAARELDYRPSFYARNLAMKRTYMVGVVTQEIGDYYGSPVISGIERYLRERNYVFLTVACRHDPQLLDQYAQILSNRGVEGFITVDAHLNHSLSLPTVAVAGHRALKGVTNIILDHRCAARLALGHLTAMGHKEIAFMKGSPLSSDSEFRWQAIREVAEELKIPLRAELIIQLEGDDPTPQLGYPFARALLARQRPFTALFAYNDISAIGSIRAFEDAGLQVPEDVSVVGFDDITIAVHSNPTLTTVRQPLQKMGELAARSLLEQIEGQGDFAPEIGVEPEFVVRNSSGRAPTAPFTFPRRSDS